MMTMPPLQALADIRMGATLRGRDATRPDPAGAFRLIQISDIGDDGEYRTHDFTRINPRESFNDDLILRSGDVLFPNRGSRTTATVFEESEIPTLVGAQFFIIRPRIENICPHYLAWTLRTKEACAYFDARRRGSIVPTLARSAVCDFPIPLPASDVQRKIVHIDKLRHQATHLESRLTALRAQKLELTLLQKVKHP